MSSTLPDTQEQLRQLNLSLDALRTHPVEWASTPVDLPSPEAIAQARRLGGDLLKVDVVPDRIMASGQGGVAFVFLRNNHYADVEILNSGSLLASTTDRSSDDTEVWEFPMSDFPATVTRIQSFLEHGNRSL